MRESKPIIIIGAGLSGLHAAETLRHEGFDGRIILIDREKEYPYDRPPLSKELMMGTMSSSEIYLRTISEYERLKIELRLGLNIDEINTENKTLIADDGTIIHWGKILLATGTKLRELNIPGNNLEGIHYLKTLADAKSVRQSLDDVNQIVIIGAGFIGAELASSFNKLGKEVTIVEKSETPLAHIFGDEVGKYFFNLHTSHGVNVITGDSVERFEGTDRVERVVTRDGKNISCQAVIVGIGVKPNTELLQEKISCENGYIVNEFGETSLPDVYAAGDCASWPYQGKHIRVEHWDHAMNHGKNVAINMVQNQTAPYHKVPYFWSDQYGYRFQYFGYTTLPKPTVWRGDVQNHRFSCFYINNEGIIEAALIVNQPKEALPVRRLIAEQKSVDMEQLANPQSSLKKVHT
ncbi:NAD(P)/FAD-dependent oxidoreductase [Alteribacillus iranensis]|uniref:3-phenylpropionate/trans-cinnamate dioxygenase ferredoxin reductase subunit n=1 Tax=Alteribacillus iranensis TaxID=930128 RepID=A0A1I2DIZ1_9BACI|nr:FAD-dependent oxidoreductase [Alteribacillus iranensis]SFE80408.1 3-phenylpropionate/trans-cinnamate dioxygenase ferredoxin reductase subunit [Alteribacillus iranensis]